MSLDALGPHDFVTIAEAARRIGVTVPRLRRALARDPWRQEVREREHETKTGTRTAQVVPVSVLIDLKALFSESQPPSSAKEEPERERVQERVWNRNGNGSQNGESALLDQLRGEVGYLREALNREQNLHAIALQALAQEQQRAAALEAQNARLIEALPTAGEEGGEPEASGAAELHQNYPKTTPTSENDRTEAEEPEEAADAAKVPWWRRLWGTGRG